MSKKEARAMATNHEVDDLRTLPLPDQGRVAGWVVSDDFGVVEVIANKTVVFVARPTELVLAPGLAGRKVFATKLGAMLAERRIKAARVAAELAALNHSIAIEMASAPGEAAAFWLLKP